MHFKGHITKGKQYEREKQKEKKKKKKKEKEREKERKITSCARKIKDGFSGFP